MVDRTQENTKVCINCAWYKPTQNRIGLYQQDTKMCIRTKNCPVPISDKEGCGFWKSRVEYTQEMFQLLQGWTNVTNMNGGFTDGCQR